MIGSDEIPHWDTIAADMRRSLKELGHPDALIDWVLTDIQPRMAALNKATQFELPADRPELFRLYEDAVPRFSAIIVAGVALAVQELVRLEVELYHALHSGPRVPHTTH